MNPFTIQGDCIDVMLELIRRRLVVQSIVTDNPYGIGFLNKKWDNPDNISLRPEVWRLCYHLLPPGGHLLAFGSPRTYHRIACAIEDAGFEIRNQIQWVYGQGFPKSLNVAKSIDRIARGATAWGGGDPESPNYGAYEGLPAIYGVYGFLNNVRTDGGGPPLLDLMRSPRQNPNVRNLSDEQRERWQQGYNGNADIVPLVSPEAQELEGWGTGLKPAAEPICLARKPLEGTVAANVLAYGTGALNIDGCRIECDDKTPFPGGITSDRGLMFAGELSTMSQNPRPDDMYPEGRWPANFIHDGSEEVMEILGSNARFFYCAKATKAERDGSRHPTIKPVELMRYLVRLVTPRGGIVLDPFAGTGTTGEAAILEGFRYLLIEQEPEFVQDIERRLGKYYNRSA